MTGRESDLASVRAYPDQLRRIASDPRVLRAARLCVDEANWRSEWFVEDRDYYRDECARGSRLCRRLWAALILTLAAVVVCLAVTS